LNKQPYKSQLGRKMFKRKGHDMGKVEDKGVINKLKEETQKKNVSTKMN
jgi:hypothetical protein